MVTKEREIGIDLLRVVSMLMIITLHVLAHGGILADKDLLPNGRYETVWFLEIAAYCGVNCYALISGYVGADKKFYFSRIMQIHLEVLFYSIGITLLFAIKMPETIGREEIKRAVFPVMNQSYWYYTSYFALFFFTPFLNMAINNLTEVQLKRYVISLLMVFCVLPVFFRADTFKIYDGYSALWLIVMYLLGAYIKRSSCFWKSHARYMPLVYLLCIIVTWLSKLLRESAGVEQTYLVKYTSPTIVLASVSLLIWFGQMRFKSHWNKMIYALGTCSFGVYLIHDNPLVRTYCIAGRFEKYSKLSLGGVVSAILLTVICIYLLCSLIDVIRAFLFKICRIDTLFSKAKVFLLKEMN